MIGTRGAATAIAALLMLGCASPASSETVGVEVACVTSQVQLARLFGPKGTHALRVGAKSGIGKIEGVVRSYLDRLGVTSNGTYVPPETGFANPATEALDMNDQDIVDAGDVNVTGSLDLATDVRVSFAGTGNKIQGAADGVTDFYSAGTGRLRLSNEFAALVARDTTQFSWSSSGLSSTPDVGLARNAAGLAAVTDGSSGFARLRVSDGGISTPAVRGADADSGLWWGASGTLNVSVEGNVRLAVTGGGAQVNGANLEQIDDNGGTCRVATESQVLATTSGATVTATNLIPPGVVVLGVTIIVKTAVTTSGATNTFSVGTGGDADAFGAGIAGALDTETTGANFTVAPVTIWSNAAQSVILDAAGAETFTAGSVRVTVHYLRVYPAFQ